MEHLVGTFQDIREGLGFDPRLGGNNRVRHSCAHLGALEFRVGCNSLFLPGRSFLGLCRKLLIEIGTHLTDASLNFLGNGVIALQLAVLDLLRDIAQFSQFSGERFCVLSNQFTQGLVLGCEIVALGRDLDVVFAELVQLGLENHIDGNLAVLLCSSFTELFRNLIESVKENFRHSHLRCILV